MAAGEAQASSHPGPASLVPPCPVAATTGKVKRGATHSDYGAGGGSTGREEAPGRGSTRREEAPGEGTGRRVHGEGGGSMGREEAPWGGRRLQEEAPGGGRRLHGEGGGTGRRLHQEEAPLRRRRLHWEEAPGGGSMGRRPRQEEAPRTNWVMGVVPSKKIEDRSRCRKMKCSGDFQVTCKRNLMRGFLQIREKESYTLNVLPTMK